MSKASLTIAISGSYNGNAIERANRSLKKMQTVAAEAAGGISGSLAQSGAKMAEFGGQIHNAGYKMEQLGKTATTHLSIPIVASAAACGKAAVDIDTALTGVKKTVDATEDQYQELKQAAIEFSKTNAVSPSQILDIEALGAQLGFTRDELQDFGEVVSGLDIATNMDAEQAGTELAQFANITKMAHSEVKNYASALVGLGNTSATTESDISSMAMRIAAAGTQVGMSQADILGLSAALASVGVEAEAGGTAISTIMSEIDKAVATNSESLDVWAQTANMSAENFATAWKNDPVNALSALLSNMEATTAEGGNMSVMLESLGVDSIRQTDIMKRMAGNSDLVVKSVQTANDEWKKNTALTNEVNNRNESMAAKFEMLKNKVVAVAEEVGTPLINATLEFVDAAEPVIDVIEDAARSFSALDSNTQKTIVGALAAAAAFGPMLTAAGKLAKGIGDVTVKIGAAKQALARFGAGTSAMSADAIKAAKDAKTLGDGVKTVGAAARVAEGGIRLLTAAMKTMGIGLVIDLVARLVGKFTDYCQTEKLVEDATVGLTDAMSAADAAYSSYTPSVQSSTDALGQNVKSAKDCLQAQADLAKSMNDTWADYGTNAAIVDNYVNIIQDLGNKGSLTADEQDRLKFAVEGFNDATNSSISIINGQTGELSMQQDAILKVADAYKEEAKQEAARELYKDNIKQLVQDQMALKSATDELSAAEEGFGIWLGDFPVIASPASDKHHELQKNVDDLTAAVESEKTVLGDLEGIIGNMSPSFDTFDQALEQSGVKLSDFGNIGAAQLNLLKSNFDGSLNSIVETCVAQGLQIPSALANGIMQNSALPENSQRVMFDALVLQMSNGDVQRAASVLGHDIDQGLKDGILGNGEMPKEAIGIMSDDTIATAKDKFQSHSPSQVMSQLGLDIDQGLAIGITDNSSQPQTAMSGLAELVKSAISNLPIFSSDTGHASGSGLSDALGSWQGSVFASASSLFASATGGISGTQGAFSETGSGAAWSYSDAIGSVSAWSSGRSLASTADSGVRSVSANGAGVNFVSGFASGFHGFNVWDAAYNVGMSALNAIKSALGIHSPSKEAEEVGMFFGEGAVIGMKKSEGAVKREAQKLSDAMSLNPKHSGYSISRNRGAYSQQSNTSTINNYYTVGDITLDLSSIKDFVTIDQLFRFLSTAKAAM